MTHQIRSHVRPGGDVTAALQQDIDTVWRAGGGTVAIDGGVLDVAGLVLRHGVVVDGKGGTTLRAPDGANEDVVTSENFATLSGSNAWLRSSGVPAGFGLRNLRIDGNKAANTSGRGIAWFGKRLVLDNIMVFDCADAGVYTECGAAGGQQTIDDMPESELGPLWVRGCDGDGVTFNGPHDARWAALYVSECAGAALRVGYSASLYNGSCDIGFAHLYACGQGLVTDAGLRVGTLVTESHDGEGAVFNATSTVGFLRAFNNQLGGTEGVSVALAARTTITQADVDCENGGTGIRATVSGSQCPTVTVKGRGTGGVGLDVDAPRAMFRGLVEGFSGAGGVGVRVGATGVRHQTRLDLAVNDCATLLHEVTAANRVRWTVQGYVNAGQTAFDTVGGGVDNVRDLVSN